MVQESSTFGVCSMFIDDQCGSSKIMNPSSCVTISLEEEEEKEAELQQRYIQWDLTNKVWEKETELMRRKREELIQKVREKRRKEVCVDAIEDLYYLVPTGKRTKGKRKSRFKVTSTFVKKMEVPRIIKIESLLKNVHGDLKNIKNAITTESIMEEIQELGVENHEISLMAEKERTPKIASFLKSEKNKKMVHNKKPNRVLLPVEFKNKIQELGVPISEVSLVIEKPLFSTDLSEKHMRLSIPVKQVVNPDKFLTPQEKEILDTRDSCNRRTQIKFNLIEPSLEECSIHLAKWPMNSSSSYVLLNDWSSMCKRNDLKVNMMVQLWSFRKDSNRWLALVVVPPESGI